MSAKHSTEELQELVNNLGKEVYLCLQREKSLRENEGRFDRLIENLEEEYFFYAHDTEGMFFYVSPSITNILGYSPDEFQTHYTEFLTDNPINDKAIEHTARSIEGKHQPAYEIEILHKNGGVHRLEVAEHPLKNKNGRVLAVEGIAHDITPRVKAEVALKKSRDELEKRVAERTSDLEQINNQLMLEIEERKRVENELREKQRQINKDLEVAASIQKSFIPSFSPSLSAIQIAWMFEPCAKVGGDLFNFYLPEENLISFYMLDACGHGISAALIAAAASQSLHSANQLKISRPETVLNGLDRVFPYERFESYFTIGYATIDISNGQLAYSNAGHPPLLLQRTNGSLEILDHHGPVIGLGSSEVFSQKETNLEPGDKLVLYTDGILDHMNPKGERFGKQRLYDAIKMYRNEPLQKIMQLIKARLVEFANSEKSDDDISLMMIGYTGNESA
jgi:sigma-B regulation protein RsbU (phosphoserine phosphatase)